MKRLERNSAARLGLGTVQWGMRYGVANATGVPSSAEVHAILGRARAYGISLLDTAPAYGDAETVLGTSGVGGFRIITKTPVAEGCSTKGTQGTPLRESIQASLERLGCRSVYGLLVHHAEDLLAPDGEALMSELLRLKADGLVRKVGASVYDAVQIEGLLGRYQIDLVQLPVNVLDQRLIERGTLRRLKDMGVEVHARSVFLQGLLTLAPAEVNPYFEPIKPLLDRFRQAAVSHGITPTQAAIAFVRDVAEVDAILVGVDGLRHLEQCVSFFRETPGFDARGLACNDPQFVNPVLWRLM